MCKGIIKLSSTKPEDLVFRSSSELLELCSGIKQWPNNLLIIFSLPVSILFTYLCSPHPPGYLPRQRKSHLYMCQLSFYSLVTTKLLQKKTTKQTRETKSFFTLLFKIQQLYKHFSISLCPRNFNVNRQSHYIKHRRC